MAFRKYQYVSDSGLVHPIRLSDKVVNAQPTPPTAGPPYDSNISADVQNTRREIGLCPRKVRLERRVGAPPNEKVYYNTMPVCAAADVATLLSAGSVTIAGVEWDVVGSIAEDAR